MGAQDSREEAQLGMHFLQTQVNRRKRLITVVLDTYLQTRVGPLYEQVKGLPDGGITLMGGTGAGTPLQ